MDDAGGFSTSNGVRLSGREWLYAAAIFLLILFLFPRLWSAAEKFKPTADWRVPYEVGNDYWVFRRWANTSASKYPVLLLGDSVMWGHYVKPDQTLPHYLNLQTGNQEFANLGIDGIQPVAMYGLLKYFGAAVKNTSVVVEVNPLWLSSPKADLQVKDVNINHPGLLPQVYPRLPCYAPSLTEVVGNVAGRDVLFFTWVNHLRSSAFENLNLADWTIMYPFKNPVSAVSLKIPEPEDRPMARPVSWKKGGIPADQNLPWVLPDESVQWRYSRNVIELLKARGDKVFVLINPYNPYIQTKPSLARYQMVKQQMESWLDGAGVAYFAAPDLPSEDYADGSHPLKEGYALMADQLLHDQHFRQWMGERSSVALGR